MKIYPAKLILFGEYTILKGSKALAVPVSEFYGSWQKSEPGNQQNLLAFAKFLEQDFSTVINAARLQKDLAQGLYFDSNIPTGYGLGSSGAVCAAVFDQYAFAAAKQFSIKELKTTFAKMESFFHGSSSGTDPLICCLQKPICLYPDGQNEIVELPPLSAEKSFFLLDSQQPRQTSPLVEQFNIRYAKDAVFSARINKELGAENNAAIAACLKGNIEMIWQHFDRISQLQLECLPELITPDIRQVWEEGLAGGDFRLKLCGAGGGGFYLGYGAVEPFKGVLNLDY